METKSCTKCLEMKPLDKFHSNGTGGRRSQCGKCVNDALRAMYPDNRGTVRARHRLWRYGIAPDEYSDLVELQGNRCVLCKQFETVTYKGRIRDLAVDHNHKTGKVRGLLCCNCNRGLGLLQDDPAVLLTAAAYVQRDGMA